MQLRPGGLKAALAQLDPRSRKVQPAAAEADPERATEGQATEQAAEGQAMGPAPLLKTISSVAAFLNLTVGGLRCMPVSAVLLLLCLS